METYSNLKELLNPNYDCPFSFGRSLYKYTDCGPWTSFIVKDSEATTEEYCVEVRQNKKLSTLELRCKNIQHLPEDMASFLGFREMAGKSTAHRPADSNDPRFTTIDSYYGLLEDFVKKEGRVAPPFEIKDYRKLPKSIRITLTKNVEATARDIYYEKTEARDGWEVWADKCIGIEIGSIVEGSDVYVDARTLLFPFTDEQLDEVVKGVDKEADFYWQRDNSRWFILQKDGQHISGVRIAWDDPVWDVDAGIPEEIRQKVNELLLAGDLPDVGLREGKQVTDLGEGWILVEYINDSTY